MASEKHEPVDPRLLDRRIVERHLKTGRLDEKEWHRHLKALRAWSPAQPRYFDGDRGPGKFVRPWNLVVPEQVLSRSWAEVP